jgi:hypothetical protein
MLPQTSDKFKDDTAISGKQTGEITLPQKQFEKLYVKCFSELGRANRVMAKAFVKLLEPKKRSKHPYTKGNAGAPEWWPDCVVHKEPNHLPKSCKFTPLTVHARLT